MDSVKNQSLINREESTLVDESNIIPDGTRRVIRFNQTELDEDNLKEDQLSRKKKQKKYKSRRGKRRSKHKHKHKEEYRVEKSPVYERTTFANKDSESNDKKTLNRFFPGLLFGTFVGSAVSNFILEGLKK
ncbi:unnamed protein product [Kluyveromyces dobzhanskii CBS 2104]|uniref:WGS project CCBQ000000000 data, contig 00011 n=1 Tax=Kluyveromyces dobzhanskii CBS 2104 TaxID=1427455 RepID=A0A0A8L9P7_9SACH|nr:unnamed protein product [Kluyveromyces dobzhanskii CBS 2104]